MSGNELDMTGLGVASTAMLEAVAEYLRGATPRPSTPMARRIGRRLGTSVNKAAKATASMETREIVSSMRQLASIGLHMPLECGLFLLAPDEPWNFERGFVSDFRPHLQASVLVKPSEHAEVLLALLRHDPGSINFERFPGYRGPRRGNRCT